MTVKELIEELSKYPSHLEVWLNYPLQKEDIRKEEYLGKEILIIE
jgi:uncharacterized protein (DUF433 family)